MALSSRATGIGNRPALLVVDASVGFTDPDSPLGAEFGTEIEIINRLLGHAHQHGWPVFLSTVVYHGDREACVFRARLPDLNLLQAGSPWVEIDPRLNTGPGDRVFEKTHASAFHRTELDAWLQSAGVDTVIVTGFTTSGCVRASAVDALQHDYRTLVVVDAVGDRDAAAHAANLRDLSLKYADVLSSDELCVAPSQGRR
ncbi:MAG: isochorismatase family protein [Pseudomonadales bacterium]